MLLLKNELFVKSRATIFYLLRGIFLGNLYEKKEFVRVLSCLQQYPLLHVMDRTVRNYNGKPTANECIC